MGKGYIPGDPARLVFVSILARRVLSQFIHDPLEILV
jgi:hypothetical protein